MTATDTKLIAKAIKIKALLDGATTEGEAAAAAEALTRLMTKHQIAEYQLTAKQASEIVNRTFDLGKGGRPNWRRSLFGIVARANGCLTCYWVGANDISIVGRPEQIEVVYDLYVRLRVAILRMAKEGYLKYCEEIERTNGETQLSGGWRFVKPDHVPVWNHSFCMGATVSLRERLQTARAGDNKAETAIIRVMDGEVKDAYETFHPSVKSAGRLTYSHSQNGWASGTAAGKNLNLGKSVPSGKGSGSLTG